MPIGRLGEAIGYGRVSGERLSDGIADAYRDPHDLQRSDLQRSGYTVQRVNGKVVAKTDIQLEETEEYRP